MPTHDRHRRRRRRHDDHRRERGSRDRRHDGDRDRRRRHNVDEDQDQADDDGKPTLTPAAPPAAAGPSESADTAAARYTSLHADPRRRSHANLPGPKRRAEVVPSSSSSTTTTTTTKMLRLPTRRRRRLRLQLRLLILRTLALMMVMLRPRTAAETIPLPSQSPPLVTTTRRRLTSVKCVADELGVVRPATTNMSGQPFT